MKDPASKNIRDDINSAVEAPLYPEQKDIEIKLLATLAFVSNSDQADAKYDILDLSVEDFHFQDHRAIFAAIKKLAAVGDYVDQATIHPAVGDAWLETLKAVFNKDNALSGPAIDSHKKKIVYWSNVKQFNRIVAESQVAVESATESENLQTLIAGLQKAVFDIGKTDRLIPPLKSEAEMLDDFLLDLADPKPGYQTGFPKLDTLIKGLNPGLFVIAAPPSAGKTTFVKQLVDQVAEQEEVPILFFSFEQSADELRIKTLSRLTKITRTPITNETLKEGKIDEKKIEKAITAYRAIGRWIKIIEGDRQHNIGRIRLLAQREKMRTGKAPVIAIDYLQILPVSSDSSAKDKRTEVDFLVSDLRRLARDLQSPIIVISSMSRAEYGKVKQSAFKESGGIEYAADIAAILSVSEEAESGSERTVALNIIKNRNGRRGKVEMTYDMEHDHFEETSFSHLNYMDLFDTDEDKPRAKARRGRYEE